MNLIKSFCWGVQGGRFFQKESPLAAGGKKMAKAAFCINSYGAESTANVSLKCADPWLEINLDHMAWNLSQIRKRVHPRPVMGVIKANAYGHYPSDKEYQERKIELKPAMSLKSQVIYVKNLRPGDAVSYHRKFTAKDETPVVTLPVGYSDGYPYQVAGKAEALIHGWRWPVIAAVTANHSTLNITGADKIKIGKEAVLIGRQARK
jgi:alanine racemase